MRHLQTSPLESALHIEPLIGLRAIENGLVAACVFRHIVQCLYNPQPQFLPLLVFRDRNVLDMTHNAEVMYAMLAFN